MSENKQDCPNCGGHNITRADKNKSDKAKHVRMKAYKCKDCDYAWLKTSNVK